MHHTEKWGDDMAWWNFFKKLNMAGGGKDPNKAMFEGLEGLGLQVGQQKGAAVTELEGNFRGREAAMVVDGSGVMRAGNRSMMSAAGTAVAGGLGIISQSHQDWRERNASFRGRQRMESAQMLLRWAVFSPTAAGTAVNIGRDASIGQAIGGGLYASGAAEALSAPQIQAALGAAQFDEICFDGTACQAFWAPPMKDYQKVAAKPDVFTQTSANALTALSAVCDALAGPVA